MTDEECAYNLEDFSSAAPAPTNPGATMAAKIGLTAPDFQAQDLNGAVVRLADFRDKRHVVMMTGAVTSPMCAFEIPEFNRLQSEFDSKGVSFFLLYTRESHPAVFRASVVRAKTGLRTRSSASGKRQVPDPCRSPRWENSSRLRCLAERTLRHSQRRPFDFSQQHGEPSRAARSFKRPARCRECARARPGNASAILRARIATRSRPSHASPRLRARRCQSIRRLLGQAPTA